MSVLDPNRPTGRAWGYHVAADTILHTRVEALLICEAFLAAAYVGILGSSIAMNEFLALAIIVLAVLITIIFLEANHRLLKGITFLKKAVIEEEGALYEDYLKAVGSRALEGRGGNASVSVRLGYVLLAFWMAVAAHLAFTHFFYPVST